MFRNMFVCLIVGILIQCVWGEPVLNHNQETIPSLISGFNSHLASRSPKLQGPDPRFPLPSLPSTQELEAIKKVAQILVMLGEQVIPGIIGDPSSLNNNGPLINVPNDPVEGSV